MNSKYGESVDELAVRRLERLGSSLETTERAAPQDRTCPPAQPDRSLRRALADALVAVVIMGVVALMILRPWQSTATNPHVRLALSTFESYPGGSYLSGQMVALAWSRMPHVAIYRVQIARAGSIVLPETVLVRPWRTILTDRTAVRLQVQGPQVYYWRVQPYLVDSWGGWSAVRVFGVAQPTVATPRVLKPRTFIVTPRHRVMLCWSRVPRAVGYRLRVDRSVVNLNGTCRSLSFRAGAHYVQVRALAQGVGIFAGPPSARIRLVARARPIARHRARVSLPRVPVSSFPAIVPVLSAPAPPVFVLTTVQSPIARTARAHRTVAPRIIHRTVPTTTRRRAVHHARWLVVKSRILHSTIHLRPVERAQPLLTATAVPQTAPTATTIVVPPPPPPVPTTIRRPMPPPPPPPPGG